MAYLQQCHVFGVVGIVTNNIHYIDEQSILYPAGSSLVVCNAEHKSQKLVPLAEGGGITAITVVSQRLAAIAERGEGKPAVSIYDLHTLKKKKTLRDDDWHGKDIIALSFSPDMKYLVMQMSEPDWLLQLWNWEKSKVYAQIKFSIPTIKVYQVTFNPFEKNIPQICVAGLNMFRIYRYTEGVLKPITFQKTDHRNNLCHAWLSAERIVVGTDESKFLYYDNGEMKSEMSYLLSDGIPCKRRLITVLHATSSGFIAGSNNGFIQIYEKSDDTSLYKMSKEIATDQAAVNSLTLSVNEDNIVVSLTNNQIISIQLILSDDMRVEKLFQAHHSGILGLDTCIRKPLIATCGTDRSVRVWNYQENSMELIKFFKADPLSVAFHPNGLYILVGFGDSVKLLKLLLDDIQPYWEQTARGCRECKFSNGGHYFAVAQETLIIIRSTWTFETIMFLRGHNTKVKSLCWSQDDAKLASVSTDGTVFDWDLRTQKRDGELIFTNCTCMSAVYSVDGKVIFAACSDGYLREIRQSQIVREIFIDGPLTRVTLGKSGRVIICATVNGHVKALRYPPNTGEVYGCRSHSGAINQVRISYDEQYAFSASEDGCLCVFKINDKELRVSKHDRDNLYSDEILALRQDVSGHIKALTDLRFKVEEIRSDNDKSSKSSDRFYTDKLKEVMDSRVKETEVHTAENLALRHEYERNLMQHADEMRMLKESQQNKIAESLQLFQKKMATEKERFNETTAKTQQLKSAWLQQMSNVNATLELEITTIRNTYETKLAEKDTEARMVIDMIKANQEEYMQTMQSIEDVTQEEVLDAQFRFQQQLKDEQLALHIIQQENVDMHRMYEDILKKIESNKQEVQKMIGEEKKLQNIIHALERDITAAFKERQERNDTVEDKDRRIHDLKKKNKELEKFKFVLDYKIVELKKQIEPREANIIILSVQIKEMEAELSKYEERRSKMTFEREGLVQTLRGVLNELDTQHAALAENQVLHLAMRRDGAALWHVSDDEHEAKRLLMSIYHKYCLTQSDTSLLNSFSVEQSESIVQRQLLEKSVNTLTKKVGRQREMREAEARKLLEENTDLTGEINTLRGDLKKLKMLKRRTST